MTKSKKIQIKEMLLEITELENRPMSIKEVTNILKIKFNIKMSPQIVKRYLEELVRERKLRLEED